MRKNCQHYTLAILGARGIPARYSGYDTLAEALALGLNKSGAARVTIYCRSSYYRSKPSTVHGAHLIYLPAPRLKALESLLHSFLSTMHVLFRKVDVIYFLDPANAPFTLLLRLCGKRVIIHTNGLGWKRRKWGVLAQRYYKFVERVCAKTANALITDNPAMKEYYIKHYNTDSVYIPYGAKHHAGTNGIVYDEIDIFPKKYLLVVARLEPENNIDLIINEYTQSKLSMPLVIVGDSPYSPGYLRMLDEYSDSRVKFVGRINDQTKLNSLYKGAYLYIHGHEVGGTNPSLLRAMDAGTAPLVIDVPFNNEVIGGYGFVFNKKKGNLAGMLEDLAMDPKRVKRIGHSTQNRAQAEFTWDSVVKKHMELFQRIIYY